MKNPEQTLTLKIHHEPRTVHKSIPIEDSKSSVTVVIVVTLVTNTQDCIRSRLGEYMRLTH